MINDNLHEQGNYIEINQRKSSKDTELILIDSDKSDKESELIYKRISFNTENVKINRILSYIDKSKLQKIRLFNYYGIEIIDDSDLYFISQGQIENLNSVCNNNIIYFTTHNRTSNLVLVKCFDFEKKLGEGGFGKVYLAKQKFSNKYYAIKIIPIRKGVDIKFLFKEVDALILLNHPNIIKFDSYFYNESEESIYLVLEYAKGGSLKEYLRKNQSLSEEKSKIIIQQLLEALSFCHSKSIIHRDLKPENIMFSDIDYFKIKIIDFGISGILKEVIKAGSLRYTPPEIVNNIDNESKPSIDTWAIGCITYELLTGNRLIKGSNIAEVKESVNNELVILANNISKEACDFISSLLRKDPVERMTIEEAKSHPWILNEKLERRNYENDYSTSAKSLSPIKLQRKPYKSNSIISSLLTINNLNNQISNNFGETGSNFNFASALRSKTIEKTDPHKSFIGQTKVTKITKDFNFHEYTSKVAIEYNGKVPTYLQPIGHSKEQKLKYNLIREGVLNFYNKDKEKKEPSTSPIKNKSKYTFNTNININKSSSKSPSTKTLSNLNSTSSKFSIKLINPNKGHKPAKSYDVTNK